MKDQGTQKETKEGRHPDSQSRSFDSSTPQPAVAHSLSSSDHASASSKSRTGQESGKRCGPVDDDSAQSIHVEGSSQVPDKKHVYVSRFNSRLTEPTTASEVTCSGAGGRKHMSRKHQSGSSLQALPTDLASSLSRALRTPPFPDCPICYSPIHPNQRTWSCSPSIPVIRLPDVAEATGQPLQYCWTTFHLKCISQWAGKSVKEVEDAWRARGDNERKGDWRCPGCQAKRDTVPSEYRCFCGSTIEPKPTRFATPHSCSNSCPRVSESGCNHPCPLLCHPGPCPPCQVTIHLQCYCPLSKTRPFRCGSDSHNKLASARGKNGRNFSCGSICNRTLHCKKHVCQQVCHEGPCDGCSVRETVKCYCGMTEKDVRCGEGEEIRCIGDLGGRPQEWFGFYKCSNRCQKLHDCGIHECEQPCHPPHVSDRCPFSPSVITSCPCGRKPISAPGSSPTPTFKATSFPPRQSCTSPIPTCSSLCEKYQAGCNHLCSVVCHTGKCPPCTVEVERPCRCGMSIKKFQCFELLSFQEILCDKPCTALRACGKHECRRICCPLAALAIGKKRRHGKKNGPNSLLTTDIGTEEGGLHECELICGKMLSCGLHKCEKKDHKGPCPRCLRSSFEELYCHCGRTALEPPIPCGTRIQCNFPCSLPPPNCGHPITPHDCHEDPSSPCPPCPILTTRECACGKKMVGNVRCSLEKEKVSCGTVCGKLMSCGFHRCERLCHVGGCGVCTTACAKARKLCLPLNHPCPLPCHAPSACSENTSCESLVTLSCSCGRIKKSSQCGRSIINPTGRQQFVIKCNNECTVAKRNAKLAEALGITPESRENARQAVTWREHHIMQARANGKFLVVVEKAFEEFVKSGKNRQMLPSMPVEKRKFVQELALMYGLDTQMVDQEPQRSVILLRRLDTHIPNPLLSSIVGFRTNPQMNLGKLADLRSTPTSQNLSQVKSNTVGPMPIASRSPAWVSELSTPSSAIACNSGAPTPTFANRAHVGKETAPIGTIPDSWEDDD